MQVDINHITMDVKGGTNHIAFRHEQAFRATVLPRAWPNRLAEQVSAADFLTPFLYSILTISTVAIDKPYRDKNSSTVDTL